MAHNVASLFHGHHVGSALHVPWVLLCLVLLVVAFRRLPLSYAAFAAVVLAVSLTSSNLDSFERYALGAFPLVIAASTLTSRRRVEVVVLVVAGSGMVGYAMLAFVGVVVPCRAGQGLAWGRAPTHGRHRQWPPWWRGPGRPGFPGPVEPATVLPLRGVTAVSWFSRTGGTPGHRCAGHQRTVARTPGGGWPSTARPRRTEIRRDGTPWTPPPHHQNREDSDAVPNPEPNHMSASWPGSEPASGADPDGTNAGSAGTNAGSAGADAGSAGTPAPVVIIGGGPAGLTAARQLAEAGDPVVVVEEDTVVGGISRTVERDGWRFDIGGHRFFTKVGPVEEFWHEILPDEDFLLRPRMSRIFYGGKFYDYPIKLGNALSNLGHGRGLPVRAVLPVGAGAPAQGPDHPRGLHRLQLRLASVPALLQDLQREGVGRVGLGDLGRLGGPADQGHVPVERGVGADPVLVGRQAAGPVQAGHQPHRGVPVPEVRPRHDVGALRRTGRGPGRDASGWRRRRPAVHVEDGAAVAVTVDHGGAAERMRRLRR